MLSEMLVAKHETSPRREKAVSHHRAMSGRCPQGDVRTTYIVPYVRNIFAQKACVCINGCVFITSHSGICISDLEILT